MPHYRGRPSLKVVESKFSHHVEMLVPEGGFGQRLGAIHAWHDLKGIPATLVAAVEKTERNISAGVLPILI